jgi:hypothetical protein
VGKPKTPSSSFHPQPSEAEHAFLVLQSEIEAYTRERQRAMVDVQIAAAIAHSVVLRDREPDRLTMFERLAGAELYDAALPDRIGQLSLATWFTRQRQLGRVALSSNASVPPDLLRNAQLKRRMMLKVLDHWFDDDPEISAEVAVIREGAGYQDLANDLEALADIYQRPTVHTVIQDDRKHYDKRDAKSARALAKSIFEGLGLGREGDAKRWGVLCQRVWTMLLADYEEHRSAGAFLFRKHEDVDESYPSLVSAARRSPSPRTTGGDQVEVDEQADIVIDADGLPEAANT